MASTYLRRTSFGTPTLATKFTISFWFKRTGLGSKYLIGCYDGSSTNSNDFVFTSDNALAMYFGGNAGSGYLLQPNRLFRDTNAWYHLVYEVDTTQATDSNRVKIYINGEQETSFSTTQYPPQNATTFIFNSVNNNIGQNWEATSNAFDGSMTHFHYIDGTAYDASTFGETDATTGIWKPKTAPVVTYGTNGFFLKFENSASFGTDSSGNANNFTVNGTMTQTIDTPSNVFAVCNKLVNTNSALSFSNGNTTITNSGQWLGTLATLGMSAGKYYWEFKSTGNFMTGVSQLNSSATETNQLNTANLGYSSRFATGYEMINGGNLSNNNNTSTPYGTSHSSGDIGMVAFDADNGTLWLGKNGTWHNSATKIEIENGTTTNSAYTGLTNSNGYIPSFSTENSTLHLNFGNGTFGTTAVSSAENPDDGIGIFEYEVPAGYKALCTKSINAQEYN
jgi:hypothetical protein